MHTHTHTCTHAWESTRLCHIVVIYTTSPDLIQNSEGCHQWDLLLLGTFLGTVCVFRYCPLLIWFAYAHPYQRRVLILLFSCSGSFSFISCTTSLAKLAVPFSFDSAVVLYAAVGMLCDTVTAFPVLLQYCSLCLLGILYTQTKELFKWLYRAVVRWKQPWVLRGICFSGQCLTSLSLSLLTPCPPRSMSSALRLREMSMDCSVACRLYPCSATQRWLP